MSHTIAIDLLPPGVTSYDLWEILVEEGLEPVILVTAPEEARAPCSLHLEFATPHDAVRARLLIRDRTARADFHALAS